MFSLQKVRINNFYKINNYRTTYYKDNMSLYLLLHLLKKKILLIH